MSYDRMVWTLHVRVSFLEGIEREMATAWVLFGELRGWRFWCSPGKIPTTRFLGPKGILLFSS